MMYKQLLTIVAFAMVASCARELPPAAEFEAADGVAADVDVWAGDLGGIDTTGDADDDAAEGSDVAAVETVDSSDTADIADGLDATDVAETADTVDGSDVPVPDTPDVPLTCPAPCTTPDPCQTASCNPKTGACETAAKADAAPCDDSQPCTADTTCQAGTCQGGKAAAPCGCIADQDCAKLDDGKLCNGVFYCDKKSTPDWSCKLDPGSVVTCQQPGKACESAACLEPGSPGGDATLAKCAIVLDEDGTPCDDGKAWTIGEACISGQCSPSAIAKVCKESSECAVYEDGDLCNGTLFCNKAQGKCQVLPKSVISCPSAADTTCQTMQCQKITGKCKVIAKSDQVACDDGLPCTTGEACMSGVCTATAGAKTCQCAADSDCGKYEDGDACNGKLFCNLAKGACEVNPVTLVVCPTGLDTACSHNVCDKSSGACGSSFAPTATACDADGSPCTPYDHCEAGKCVADTSICPCTADADCAGWEDGDLCNGGLYCEKKSGTCKVNPATVKSCPSAGDSACSKNICVALSGACSMTAVGEGGGCDDGSVCTTGDKCSGGKCSDVGTVVCNDSQGCTDDSCEPTKGCVFKPNAAPCDDGNVCTAGDKCGGGACSAGSAVVCDDKNACTNDNCSKAFGGCMHDPKPSGSCDDGDACTSGDACQFPSAKCLGAGVKCDDGNVCTTDSCDKALGCVYSPNSSLCTDGDACTVGDTCVAKACSPGPSKACDDANPCTTDSCDKAQGCVYQLDSLACNDGDACTVGDKCSGGKCSAVGNVVCDDANTCTGDSCDKTQGCVYQANSLTCTDGDACTVGDKCKAGACGPGAGAVCADGDVCTDDGCESAKGCVFAMNTAPCSDGDACTTGDTCSFGACLPNDVTTCDDAEGCTTDACDAATGCTHVAQADGTACLAGGVQGKCAANKCVVPKAVSISAGGQHVCAVLENGAVACWGVNASGQLGDGTAIGRAAPVEVQGLKSPAKAVAAGGSHTCALLQNGGVRCWGSATGCQLGASVGANKSLVPVQVSGLAAGVQAITAGASHSCALLQTGEVRCWGWNEQGALGDGTTVTKCIPTQVFGLTSGVKAIASGLTHNCALSEAGQVSCWGNNDFGKLGMGTQGGIKSKPVQAVGLPTGLVAIATGYSNTCVVVQDGSVACWGANTKGIIADDPATMMLAPTVLTGLAGGTSLLAVGGTHICVAAKTGTVQCRGSNARGQLGDGSGVDKVVPSQVVGLTDGVSALVANSDNTCALLASGTVNCWGNNVWGALGIGKTAQKTKPSQVMDLKFATQVAAGSEHTLALLASGAVYAWGRNSDGRLGDGTTESRTKPVAVSGMAAGGQAVATGSSHSCVLLKSAAVKCWGGNDFGALGDGTQVPKLKPPAAPALTAVQSISAGFVHTCAVLQDGGAKCWGGNQEGALGTGDVNLKLAPTSVVGLNAGVQMVDAGAFHTCALLTTGAVKCWGRNTEGQLGNGANANEKTPVQVTGLTEGVQALAVGGYHSCALLATGAVQCWGKGHPKTPIAVAGLGPGVQAIAAGHSHRCALLQTGEMKCWGLNSGAQIGDGTLDDKVAPTQVWGLTSGVQSMAGGDSHTCAVVNGQALCWGAGDGGQLGDGDAWAMVPMRVLDIGP